MTLDPGQRGQSVGSGLVVEPLVHDHVRAAETGDAARRVIADAPSSQDRVSYAAIARILGVHRGTLTIFIKRHRLEAHRQP